MGHVLTTRALMLHDGCVVEQRGCTLTPEERARLEAGSHKLAELADESSLAELPEGEVRDILRRLGIDTVTPLRSGESSHGALLLGPRASGKPSANDDRDFLRSLVSQAAAALDNLRLTREFVEKQKIEKEMAIARRIQQTLLPESEPGIDGWDIAGINIPCLTVGGDYFDYVDRGGGKHWLVIADVSGKGTGAALLMASVQAALHALAGLGEISLEALAERLNKIVYSSTEGNRYVTAFFAMVDAPTGETTFVNAGHCFPVLLRGNGTVERLEEGGPRDWAPSEDIADVGTDAPRFRRSTRSLHRRPVGNEQSRWRRVRGRSALSRSCVRAFLSPHVRSWRRSCPAFVFLRRRRVWQMI